MAGTELRASHVFNHLLFTITSPDYTQFHRWGNGSSKTLLTCSSLGKRGTQDSHSILTPKPVFLSIRREKMIPIGV